MGSLEATTLATVKLSPAGSMAHVVQRWREEVTALSGEPRGDRPVWECSSGSGSSTRDSLCAPGGTWSTRMKGSETIRCTESMYVQFHTIYFLLGLYLRSTRQPSTVSYIDWITDMMLDRYIPSQDPRICGAMVSEVLHPQRNGLTQLPRVLLSLLSSSIQLHLYVSDSMDDQDWDSPQSGRATPVLTGNSRYADSRPSHPIPPRTRASPDTSLGFGVRKRRPRVLVSVVLESRKMGRTLTLRLKDSIMDGKGGRKI